MWNRSHLPNDLLERVLLWKHIEKISPLAYHSLNSLWVQKVGEPHPIEVTIGLHLEYELADAAEAKAAMPPGICQEVIRLTIVRICRLARFIPMHRCSPAIIINKEFERVEIILKLKMQNRRDFIAPPQEIDSVSARNLIHVRHYQQIIISYASKLKEPIQHYSLISFLDKWVLPLLKSPRNITVSQSGLHKFELIFVGSKNQRFWESSEGRIRFEENKLCYIRVQLLPPDSEEVQLIAEQHSIVDTSGELPDPPTVELAEVLHGHVLMVVMRDFMERFGWRLP